MKRGRKPVPPEEQCTEKVWMQLGIGGEIVQCSNRGKYIKDGRLVCGVHSEEAERRRKERSAEHWRRQDARHEAKQRAFAQAELFPELLKVLRGALAWAGDDFRATWATEGRALLDKVRTQGLEDLVD